MEQLALHRRQQLPPFRELIGRGLGFQFLRFIDERIDDVSLAARFEIPTEQIAPIGDMPNDVLMFAHSGLSIAMGNATPEVQRAARRVTTSNEEEGFADAVERFILPQA